MEDGENEPVSDGSTWWKRGLLGSGTAGTVEGTGILESGWARIPGPPFSAGWCLLGRAPQPSKPSSGEQTPSDDFVTLAEMTIRHRLQAQHIVLTTL